MSERVQQVVSTNTGVADSGTFEVEVDTSGADRVLVYVDDNAGGTPSSYDYDIDVALDDVSSPTYMPRSSVSSSTATHHAFTDVAPFSWKFTFTNSSGGSADYRVRVISLKEA